MTRQLGSQSRPLSAAARKLPRLLAALAAAALMAIAAPGLVAQGLANSKETLGTGDTIRITVFQNPDLTTEARVSEQGTVQFPLIGEVAVSGQTPVGAANRVAEQLKKGQFLKNPQVNVAVVLLRSRQVSVLGHVVRPGRYALDDTSSKLTDILALAGGITATGDDTITLVLTRNGHVSKLDIDLAKMYRSGDLSSNIEVQNGDTIFVQPAPVFYIYGEVQRAGAYRLQPNMIVMHALSLGGGLTPRGTDRGLKIHRRLPDGIVHKLDAKPVDTVLPDDVIYVRESLF
jgi:polysaccharide export outer membrane protein